MVIATPTKAFDWSRSCAYDAAAKRSFHGRARSRLRDLAAALQLPAGSFDIRTNKGGIAVSGESILHATHLYVQVSQSYSGKGMGVLLRRCNGRTDYVGERNHWLALSALDDVNQLARYIRTIILQPKED
jgi:hypothetical protein